VVMRNVVQEEASNPAQERPVGGGDGTAEEGPLLVTEVCDGWVGVVQVREHSNPAVGKLEQQIIR
jgi:hypothetical protein